VIGLALGFAAGVVNVVRAAQAYARTQPPASAAGGAGDDEED
jgi:F0F1-type ATP synthase assembly protein I